MCGIIGAINFNLTNNLNWIEQATNSIRYRGPDSSGFYLDKENKIILQHLRLSIIDTTSRGSQPMSDNTESVYIIFNGEIYNFKDIRNELINCGVIFSSNTDTEVILKGYKIWGIDVIKKLNGTFAFAILDKKKSKIYLARDRAGEKPLFYFNSSKLGLFFASELKALLQNKELPKTINLESLNYYLSVGYIPKDLCILKDFKKLPPAHYLEYNLINKSLTLKKYWELPSLDFHNESLEDCSDGLLKILKDSIKIQLNADVPLGLLLSGGLDSSLITALASEYKSKISTYNVSFPKYKNYDESSHANLIANHFSTNHTNLEIEDDIISFVPSIINQLDEPMIDSSIIPTYLISNAISKHCKVAIGGDGGDELFGGYNHYRRFLKMQKYLSFIPISIRNKFTNLINFFPNGLRGKSFLSSINKDLNVSLPYSNFFMSQSFLKELLQKKYIENFVDSFRDQLITNEENIIQRSTRFDFSNYLPEDILVKIDRASMLNSLEMRAPFLDYRVIEYAFRSVPSDYKVNQNDKKILLKHLAKKILPKDFNFQRKQGFSIPINESLKEAKNLKYFKDILMDSGSFFDKDSINLLFKEQKVGFKNGERLFGLLIFETWRNQYLNP